MWGMHIGLGFATRVTHGGFWALVAVALAIGDPVYGALLMLVYWLGRALPVWVAPRLLESTSDSIGAIFDPHSVYHRMAGFGLVWSGGVAVLFALSPQVR
jgi:cytochrome c biogenesis protein CcdA